MGALPDNKSAVGWVNPKRPRGRDPDWVQDVWVFQQGMGVYGGGRRGVPSPSLGESHRLPPGLTDWHGYSSTHPTHHLAHLARRCLLDAVLIFSWLGEKKLGQNSKVLLSI